MNSYQGKVLAFIGDCRATKELTPICLLQTKAWQWYTGQAVDNAEALVEHYSDPDTRGTWWRPTWGQTTEMKAPYLLSIPNALVNLLCNQGTQATPADVWTTINNMIANGGTTEVQGETTCRWCIVAAQAGGNDKSLLAIDVNLVVINDDEFNTCVGHKLDIALGPCAASTMAALVPDPNTLPDYVKMSKLLASTVGQGMMQFTQVVMPKQHSVPPSWDKQQPSIQAKGLAMARSQS
jgi:hypothetical protein